MLQKDCAAADVCSANGARRKNKKSLKLLLSSRDDIVLPRYHPDYCVLQSSHRIPTNPWSW